MQKLVYKTLQTTENNVNVAASACTLYHRDGMITIKQTLCGRHYTIVMAWWLSNRHYVADIIPSWWHDDYQTDTMWQTLYHRDGMMTIKQTLCGRHYTIVMAWWLSNRHYVTVIIPSWWHDDYQTDTIWQNLIFLSNNGRPYNASNASTNPHRCCRT